MENSERDGNTRPLYLPPEKSVFRSRSNNWNLTWNNQLVQNWEWSMSRLYIVYIITLSISSPYLFNFYTEYIMRNAWLDEAQAGINIARRNISNLRYTDDTTLIAESKEKLKSLLMKVKGESENISSNLNIQKTKIMASGPTTSWQIDGETMETVTDFIWGGSKITADGYCSNEIKRRLLLGRKAMIKLDSILKSKDITFPTKVHVSQSYSFSSSHIWMSELDHKAT